MSHVSQVNESCLTCEWVMSHMWTSHVSHVNESCLMCGGRLTIMDVINQVHTYLRMRHVAHVNESCLTCEWVMSHIWKSAHHHYGFHQSGIRILWNSHVSHGSSYITHDDESCLTCEWVTSHMWRPLDQDEYHQSGIHISMNESCLTFGIAYCIWSVITSISNLCW